MGGFDRGLRLIFSKEAKTQQVHTMEDAMLNMSISTAREVKLLQQQLNLKSKVIWDKDFGFVCEVFAWGRQVDYCGNLFGMSCHTLSKVQIGWCKASKDADAVVEAALKSSEQHPVILIPRVVILFPLEKELKKVIEDYPNAVFVQSVV